MVAILDGNGIVSLSNQSNVVYISADRPLSPTLSTAAPAVNADFAWQSNYTGAGVAVALIDSGVANHADLYQGIFPISRVVYQQSFVPGNSSAADQYGHGTHIAGLIAGDGLSSTGFFYNKTFKGIAPGAKIVNLRVLDANGASTDSVVIAAIDKAISLKSTYNIRVINLSMGRAVYESYKLDPLCQAVEKAWKNGIVVVVAAGNNGRFQPTNGYGTVTSPANDPYVITVGSMKTMGTPQRDDDQIAELQFQGANADRWNREAGCRRTRQPAGFARGAEFDALQRIPGQPRALQLLRQRRKHCVFFQLLHAQWNQHGRGRGERSRRRSASGEPSVESGSGEGSADEDCVEVIPDLQQHDGSEHGHYLYRSIRPVHDWSGLRGLEAALSSTDVATGTRCLRSRPTIRIRAMSISRRFFCGMEYLRHLVECCGLGIVAIRRREPPRQP